MGACSQTFMIPAGKSSYPVRVLASYLGCSVGHPGGGFPACLPGMKAPALSPGDYHATLFFLVSQFAPVPSAIPVRVTPAKPVP